MKTAVIGGGAAGFFLAINLKERMPEMDVTILERSHQVLRKVEISGGGRCNCTNSFEAVKDLQSVYPRGHRVMKRLFNIFNHQDTYRWFEDRGVELVTQDDECVFPKSQDSHTIINLFLSEAKRLNIHIKTGKGIDSLAQLDDYDYIAVTTGGQPREEGLAWLGHQVEKPVPSLFTLSIGDDALKTLMGTVVNQASAMIPGTKIRSSGPLLITHWGLSGPCILRLSSYAARTLCEANYRVPLAINWVDMNETETAETIAQHIIAHPQKMVVNAQPFPLPHRLWNYLADKTLAQKMNATWSSLSKKDINRMVNTLVNDTYQTTGRAAFKDEFVTCGGIALNAVNLSTLESKTRPRLYFAGEVLDIDGVTGGFNFQAAWTTAFTVAKAIAEDVMSHQEK